MPQNKNINIKLKLSIKHHQITKPGISKHLGTKQKICSEIWKIYLRENALCNISPIWKCWNKGQMMIITSWEERKLEKNELNSMETLQTINAEHERNLNPEQVEVHTGSSWWLLHMQKVWFVFLTLMLFLFCPMPSAVFTSTALHAQAVVRKTHSLGDLRVNTYFSRFWRFLKSKIKLPADIVPGELCRFLMPSQKQAREGLRCFLIGVWPSHEGSSLMTRLSWQKPHFLVFEYCERGFYLYLSGRCEQKCFLPK